MKLKKYIKNLKKFAKENPETLEMQVITSKDDEGNGYNLVYFPPIKGNFEDTEFIPYEQYEEYDLTDKDTNTVCVN